MTALHAIDLKFLVAKYRVVRKSSPHRTKALRDAFNLDVRNSLYTRCINELCDKGITRGEARHVLSRCEKHHILPLQFGGTNDPKNLAMVYAPLHRPKLHNYIDLQAESMRVGQEGLLLIPEHPRGALVWFSVSLWGGVPIRILNHSKLEARHG